MFGKTYKLADSHEYTGQFECSLFTDPKLLDLIHSDLEEIKKRNSIDPRALREHNEPVEDHSRDHIIENNVLENHARNNHIKDVNNRDANGK